MWEHFFSFVKAAFGINGDNVNMFLYMCLRGIIVYFSSVILLRFNRRFAGIRTPFNFILFVMLGSISAVAITGSMPFLPVYGIILLLMLVNRIVASIVFYSPFVERLIKGPVVRLVNDGEIQWDNMVRSYVTKRELLNELHNQLHTMDLSIISSASLTSDGAINFIIKKSK